MKTKTWNQLNSAERLAIHLMDINGDDTAINNKSARSLASANLVTVNKSEKTPFRNRVYTSLTAEGIALAKDHR